MALENDSVKYAPGTGTGDSGDLQNRTERSRTQLNAAWDLRFSPSRRPRCCAQQTSRESRQRQKRESRLSLGPGLGPRPPAQTQTHTYGVVRCEVRSGSQQSRTDRRQRDRPESPSLGVQLANSSQAVRTRALHDLRPAIAPSPDLASALQLGDVGLCSKGWNTYEIRLQDSCREMRCLRELLSRRLHLRPA